MSLTLRKGFEVPRYLLSNATWRVNGRSPDWLKFKNPAAPAVRRDAGEVLSGKWQIGSIWEEREVSVESATRDNHATPICDPRRSGDGETRGLASGRRTSLPARPQTWKRR